VRDCRGACLLALGLRGAEAQSQGDEANKRGLVRVRRFRQHPTSRFFAAVRALAVLAARPAAEAGPNRSRAGQSDQPDRAPGAARVTTKIGLTRAQRRRRTGWRGAEAWVSWRDSDQRCADRGNVDGNGVPGGRLNKGRISLPDAARRNRRVRQRDASGWRRHRAGRCPLQVDGAGAADGTSEVYRGRDALGGVLVVEHHADEPVRLDGVRGEVRVAVETASFGEGPGYQNASSQPMTRRDQQLKRRVLPPVPPPPELEPQLAVIAADPTSVKVRTMKSFRLIDFESFESIRASWLERKTAEVGEHIP
jgi:hypothetical protein